VRREEWIGLAIGVPVILASIIGVAIESADRRRRLEQEGAAAFAARHAHDAPKPARADSSRADPVVPTCDESAEPAASAKVRQAFVDGWDTRPPHRPLQRSCETLILRVVLPTDCEDTRIDPALRSGAAAAGFRSIWCVGHNYRRDRDEARSIGL
jgi:hypothetical protein